jgi:hypothetical protein
MASRPGHQRRARTLFVHRHRGAGPWTHRKEETPASALCVVSVSSVCRTYWPSVARFTSAPALDAQSTHAERPPSEAAGGEPRGVGRGREPPPLRRRGGGHVADAPLWPPLRSPQPWGRLRRHQDLRHHRRGRHLAPGHARHLDRVAVDGSPGHAAEAGSGAGAACTRGAAGAAPDLRLRAGGRGGARRAAHVPVRASCSRRGDERERRRRAAARELRGVPGGRAGRRDGAAAPGVRAPVPRVLRRHVAALTPDVPDLPLQAPAAQRRHQGPGRGDHAGARRVAAGVTHFHRWGLQRLG